MNDSDDQGFALIVERQDTALAEVAMYCRLCRYPLIGLPLNRCPECGTCFDPNDSSTFSSTPAKRSYLALWMILGSSLLVLCMFLLTDDLSPVCTVQGGRIRPNSTEIASMMIDTFRLDMGRYPHNLQELMEKPDSAEAINWYGPYLKDARDLQDVWGRPLRYCAPGQVNPQVA